MSTPTPADHARAREIFKDFHILGRRWLDVAEKTEPARDFDAMIRGCTQPTADARTILGILNDIALALAAERERVLAACAAVADNRADTMNRLGKAEQDRGDLGGGLRCSLMAGALTELADAIRALGAPPLPARKEDPNAVR